MAKTALLVASALLLFLGQADAGTKTVTISLDGLCDLITVSVQNKDLAAALETDSDGRCETFIGEGRIAKTKNPDRVADISGNFNSNPSEVFTLDIQYPFVTGGTWQMYETTDGIHMQVMMNGTYTVSGTIGASLRQSGKRLADVSRH